MITKNKFILPLYNNIIYYIYVVDTVEEAKKVRSDFKDYCESMYFFNGNPHDIKLILRFDKICPSIIVHECTHLSFIICDILGIKSDSQNNEPFAYIVEHIFNTAVKSMMMHEVKLKKSIVSQEK